MWLLVLILQLRFLEVFAVRYNTLGCWGDTGNRAIPTLERTDPTLMDNYKSRSDAILKCARVALARNYEVFAVQHGGWCAGSANARSTYKKYGSSTACAADGEGGQWANQVYEIIVQTVSGQTEIEVASNKQVAYWNVLYNTCLSAPPMKVSATATPSDQNSPHRFNVTIVDIQRYSVLVGLKRTDQDTGWDKMRITVNWILNVPDL
uniref:uncharacterized protein LOC108951050 isoform X1 n=2 Tax=Ciona intestinalis TaxID=7719 RepID=UPI000EF43F5D|nr:uncharacterized protein LOC108951050 isoform X1 [Ciona intestinalis]|eukprot:XP_026696272.1 uncharacterized protein LOC108951050 isoform X1 [Ciona intestinalis]